MSIDHDFGLNLVTGRDANSEVTGGQKDLFPNVLILDSLHSSFRLFDDVTCLQSHDTETHTRTSSWVVGSGSSEGLKRSQKGFEDEKKEKSRLEVREIEKQESDIRD